MFRFLRTTLNPNGYHGTGKRPPYFEGWYYKLADASQAHRYAIIPGVFLGQDMAGNQAFVQVFDGQTGRVVYHRYPFEEFRSAEGVFDLRVGPNRFTAEQISLRLEGPEQTVSGDLRFNPVTPWPVSLTSPGIMGWYAWIPFMQCYHGVVSLDHAIEGTLTVDGQPMDFTGGRGYTEKDWGSSFPDAWVWMQTNHFEQPGTSLTASVAIIPWLGRAFPGFIIGLWHTGTLYRLATYTGARIENLRVTDERVTWAVRDRRYRLEMLAVRSEGGLVHAPRLNDMGGRVAETLTATVEVRLSAFERGGTRLVFEGTGRHAGLETAGDLERLVGMGARR
jgi:hypothetical protein